MGFQSFVWLFFIIVRLIINCAITKTVDSASCLPLCHILNISNVFTMSWFVRVKQGLQKSPGQSVWVTPTSSITSPQMDTSAVCDGLREQEIKGLWSRQKHLVTFKSNFACQHHWVCLDFNILTHLNMKPHDDNHSFFKVCFYFCRQGTWDKHQLLFLETPQSSEGLCALWFLIGDQCMLIVKLALWGDRTPLFSYSSLLKQADTHLSQCQQWA